VRAPGLYELPEGARVADAIEAAGGPRRGADLDLLNLAEALVDGIKVEVVRTGETPVPAAAGSAEASPLVNVNTADAVMLETIPGIGPVTAAAIIAHREASGSFESVEELLEVQGIGPATLESLRAYVTV
jgi:competence protein ComEA